MVGHNQKEKVLQCAPYRTEILSALHPKSPQYRNRRAFPSRPLDESGSLQNSLGNLHVTRIDQGAVAQDDRLSANLSSKCQIVRGNELKRRNAAKRFRQFATGARIEHGGRLIQKDGFRSHRQNAGKRNTTLFAAGKPVDSAGSKCGNAQCRRQPSDGICPRHFQTESLDFRQLFAQKQQNPGQHEKGRIGPSSTERRTAAPDGPRRFSRGVWPAPRDAPECRFSADTCADKRRSSRKRKRVRLPLWRRKPASPATRECRISAR